MRSIIMTDLPKNFVKKILAKDSETKFRVEFHDIAPNSVFPVHRHTSEEWVYVLKGKLEDEFGKYPEGTFRINKKILPTRRVLRRGVNF